MARSMDPNKECHQKLHCKYPYSARVSRLALLLIPSYRHTHQTCRSLAGQDYVCQRL